MLESGVGTGAGAAAKSAANHATAVTVYGTAGIGLVAAILAMAVVLWHGCRDHQKSGRWD